MTANGAAAVEILRAELARAEEQARINNAAAEKASAELKVDRLLGANARREYPRWRVS